MAGMIIPVITKRRFDFSSLPASATVEYVMVKSLDVSHWTELSVWMRIHAKNFAQEGAQIQVWAYDTAPSAEEPSSDFFGANGIGIGVLESFATPGLLGGDASSLSGAPFVRFTVKGVQGSGTGSLWADLSVDLVAKARD
jgi:hypothetical protein